VGSALWATVSKAFLEQKERVGQGVLFLLLYLFVPLLSGFLINLRFPFRAIGIERLLLLATPALYILVALGLFSLKGKRTLLYLAGLILIAVCGLSLFHFYTIVRYAEDDYRPLIARLEALAQPEDVIVAVHPWQVGYSLGPGAGGAAFPTPPPLVPYPSGVGEDPGKRGGGVPESRILPFPRRVV